MEHIKRNINQQIARDQWNESEWPDRHDSNANKRLELFNRETFNVDVVQITEKDFENIVLPAHHEGYIHCSHELTLQKLLNRFAEKLPDSETMDKCQKRINHILDYFDSNFTDSIFVQGKFMFITTNLELSVNNNYLNNGYYTGSFHQFAAYALWIVKNSFKPLRLYLIQ